MPRLAAKNRYTAGAGVIIVLAWMLCSMDTPSSRTYGSGIETVSQWMPWYNGSSRPWGMDVCAVIARMISIPVDACVCGIVDLARRRRQKSSGMPTCRWQRLAVPRSKARRLANGLGLLYTSGYSTSPNVGNPIASILESNV